MENSVLLCRKFPPPKKKGFLHFREKGENKIVVFLNLSKNATKIKPKMEDHKGEYLDYFTDEKIKFPLRDSLNLDPWAYKVLVR